MQKFIVVCSGRTGSNLLCGILASHPYVISYYEVFHPSAIFMGGDSPVRKEQILAERDADPISFIKHLYSRSGGHHALGFKLLLTQNEVAMEHCLTDPGVKKIILSRENVLAQFSSQKIAEQTEQWAKVSEMPDVGAKLVFDHDEFLEYLNETRANYQAVDERLTNIPDDQIVRIEYTNIAERKTVASLFKFVGVPNFEITFPAIKKQNTSAILDRFENPSDVVDTLRDLGKPEWIHENVRTWRVNKLKRFVVVSKRWLGKTLGRTPKVTPALQPNEDALIPLAETPTSKRPPE